MENIPKCLCKLSLSVKGTPRMSDSTIFRFYSLKELERTVNEENISIVVILDIGLEGGTLFLQLL